MLPGVLGHWGCCNRMPQARWLINKGQRFLTLLRAGKSKIKALADPASREGLLPGSQMAVSSLCPHVMERAGERSGSLLYGHYCHSSGLALMT